MSDVLKTNSPQRSYTAKKLRRLMPLYLGLKRSFKPSPFGVNADGTRIPGDLNTLIFIESAALQPIAVIAVKQYDWSFRKIAVGSLPSVVFKPFAGDHVKSGTPLKSPVQLAFSLNG